MCDGRTGGPCQESPSGSGAPSVAVADTSPGVASSATFAEVSLPLCLSAFSLHM